MYIFLAAATDNGRRFGNHCRRRTSPISIKHRGRSKYINFCINLMIQTKLFDEGHGTGMHKATHPRGGVDSSNSCRPRGWRLHHHGGVVCLVICAFCVLSDL
jgi:hypothetical protein